MLAIIGGSGLTQLPGLSIRRREVVRTPYGQPSGALTFGELGGRPVVFLARHGYGHTIPPHLVNYRANIWALHAQKVTHVVAVATVGGIHPELRPGRLVVPDQIIDYSHGRETTFAEYGHQQVSHTDFTWPYCEATRQCCIRALAAAGEDFMAGGVYGCVQGPRLETKAEIDRMARDGADMVGMTGMPEAYLAREIGLCYAALGASANWAAGRGDSETAISASAIDATMQQIMGRVRTVLAAIACMDFA
ncbi:MAG: 5'-methylthioadenosine phosphorylase [Hydrogenophilales bacterium CG03_land_8_20_14_0_80_62_28]|nr:S-methyl-5'-thioinosine phosphorylase [Betaproteobacteria bacterium]OIO79987.1 MAG: 5'-methylthioadenosine phosphorylase [Hydrogenophilaceae bacterium CG1_02_62_390]PIV22902.1 MAG: 5'-methylthioadenosine phosphorylase [Hydrogenophilales bacterium CG03_land_8_20_14_0_80_62_28]PIW39460.1 MAG: 5'-methylthioadenosine phosphorylase [Hydrogenophilales bacterium CG15_BIG_FIL_POST_REV_8_21_14_020_62_31]PIW72674.1 MAG: 5'-methylthioadenosine phosphorylase [Hydrogenophilales bacterium CG12_big_fil_rev